MKARRPFEIWDWTVPHQVGHQVPAGGSADAPISLDDLRRRRDEILRSAARHGIRNVRVFGSVARGEATATSDIDFLVDLDRERSLLDLAGLIVDMEDLFGRHVDVVTVPGMKPRMRDEVLAEAVAL